jgi:hypothetical protein
MCLSVLMSHGFTRQNMSSRYEALTCMILDAAASLLWRHSAIRYVRSLARIKVRQTHLPMPAGLDFFHPNDSNDVGFALDCDLRQRDTRACSPSRCSLSCVPSNPCYPLSQSRARRSRHCPLAQRCDWYIGRIGSANSLLIRPLRFRSSTRSLSSSKCFIGESSRTSPRSHHTGGGVEAIERQPDDSYDPFGHCVGVVFWTKDVSSHGKDHLRIDTADSPFPGKWTTIPVYQQTFVGRMISVVVPAGTPPLRFCNVRAASAHLRIFWRWVS